MKWYEATITADIYMSDPCPRCRGQKFQCTDCEDGHAVRHMWGYVRDGNAFFKKGTKVIVARRDSWLGEHDWNGVWQSIQYPEMYFVFDPHRSGKKLRVTTAYATEHLRRVRPFRQSDKIGDEAIEEWEYQMSR